MIGIDTNVLIRYLTQDDPKQAAKANKLIDRELSASQPGFVTLITLVEIIWVLESCYDQPKSAIIDVVESLLSTKQLMIEKAEIAYQALKRFSDKTADFSDTLIVVIAENQGCEKVMTFDKKATRVGMTLL